MKNFQFQAALEPVQKNIIRIEDGAHVEYRDAEFHGAKEIELIETREDNGQVMAVIKGEKETLAAISTEGYIRILTGYYSEDLRTKEEGYDFLKILVHYES